MIISESLASRKKKLPTTPLSPPQQIKLPVKLPTTTQYGFFYFCLLPAKSKLGLIKPQDPAPSLQEIRGKER